MSEEYIEIDMEPYVETPICGRILMQLNAEQPGWVRLRSDGAVAMSHPGPSWEFMRDVPGDPWSQCEYSDLMVEWTTLALVRRKQGQSLSDLRNERYPRPQLHVVE